MKTVNTAIASANLFGLRPYVLVVDDHDDIRQPLAIYLERQGFEAIPVAGAAEMWAVLRQQPVDLIVLDIMLQDGNGLALCRELAETGDTPVIFLTALADYQDRIKGLEAGADDYLIKPFDPAELAARIRTVLRRFKRAGALSQQGQCVEFEGWRFNIPERELLDPAGQRVSLSDVEYQLLGVLVHHSGEILSRDRLLDLMNPDELSVLDRSIDTKVCRLRKKLETGPESPRLIKTVRGGGYLFAVTPRTVSA